MFNSILFTLSALGAANAYTVVSHDLFMYKNVDPIVKPGTYNSHMHSFFGSDAVTKDLPTSAELQAGCISGENPNDASVYWVPTLYYVNPANGNYTPVNPFRFSTYYENIGDAEIAIPQNYNVVVGNAAATKQDEVAAGSLVQWFCEHGPADETKDAAQFPRKTCTTHLQTLLYFHDCVDPVSLNSTYNNPSYGTTNRCPAGMKRIPRLRFSIRYDLRKIIPNGWDGEAPLALACGSSYCSHGDFINGWFEDAAEDMLLSDDKREFRAVSGSHDNASSNCTPADQDPDNGTSDYLTSVEMQKSEGAAASTGTGAAVEATAETDDSSCTPTEAQIEEYLKTVERVKARRSLAERRRAHLHG